MEDTTTVERHGWEDVKNKLFRPSSLTLKIAIVLSILVLLGGVLYAFKGWFIAASVNGSPIWRLTIMQEAEKQGGAQILDTKIVETLVEQALDSAGVSISDDELTAAMKKIEDSITSQGGTLEDALKMQGMTRSELEKQVTLEERVRKYLSDKSFVSPEEVTKYITDNKISVPEGSSKEELEKQITDMLQSQKIGSAAGEWITELRSNASIKTFVEY